MLKVKECLKKANRNKSLVLQKLSRMIDTVPDWITVLSFYSALHFVDAHLLKHHDIQRENHEERERAVATLLTEIFPAYKRLFEMSFRSRYLRVEDNPTPDEADSAIKYDLPEIEKFVMQRMT